MRIGKADGDYEDRDLGDLPYAHPTRQAESHSPRTKWNCRQGRQPLRDGQTDSEGARRLTAKLMPLYRDYDELTMRGFSPEVRATLKAALSRVVQNVTQAC